MDATMNGIVEIIILKFMLIIPTMHIKPKSSPNPPMLM
jgi:hypothetical protein